LEKADVGANDDEQQGSSVVVLAIFLMTLLSEGCSQTSAGPMAAPWIL
jgi:hypothetical protein